MWSKNNFQPMTFDDLILNMPDNLKPEQIEPKENTEIAPDSLQNPSDPDVLIVTSMVTTSVLLEI
jgi:hypothetical protein